MMMATLFPGRVVLEWLRLQRIRNRPSRKAGM